MGFIFLEAEIHSADRADGFLSDARLTACILGLLDWLAVIFGPGYALLTGCCVFPVVRRASRGVLQIIIILILNVNIVAVA